MNKEIAYIDSELEEIIPMFFENTQEDIQTLQGALDKADYETVKRLGHSIKGASLGYGFDEMGRLGLAIENAAGENKSREDIQRLVDALVSHVNTVEVVYK